jgi:hypothetical protein
MRKSRRERGGECVLRIPDSWEFPLGRKAHMEKKT